MFNQLLCLGNERTSSSSVPSSSMLRIISPVHVFFYKKAFFLLEPQRFDLLIFPCLLKMVVLPLITKTKKNFKLGKC